MPDWLEWTLLGASIVATLVVYGWLGWLFVRCLLALPFPAASLAGAWRES